MSKAQTVIVNLPFDGFYDSMYSGAIDREEEMFIEYRCDEYEKDNPDNEGYWPEQLKIDAQQYSDILINVTSYQTAHEQLARDYVCAFDFIAGEAFEMEVSDTRKRYNFETGKLEKQTYMRPSMRAEFESMDSPREYNFTTDRVYAKVPLKVMRELFKRSKVEKHATLAAVIEERFTSYDGFLSHYRNRLDAWLAKPLQDWDHNEMGTLLIAAMRKAGSDPEDGDTRERFYEGTCGDEGASQAWESAVDWKKFDSKRLELRAEQLAEWIEEDCEAAAIWRANHFDDYASIVAAEPSLFAGFEDIGNLPYRCHETVDMFTGKAG